MNRDVEACANLRKQNKDLFMVCENNHFLCGLIDTQSFVLPWATYLFLSAMDKIGKLKGILANMKVAKKPMFFDKIEKLGTSDMFSYATSEKFEQDELKVQRLNTWDKFAQYDIKNATIRLPQNGFEEMIMLTEEGRLWHYPIDNEQGMDAEKQVPFEDHVFLDQHLEDFPDNEYIRSFMEYVILGLAKNHHMTVDRKHEIIKFYKDYFSDKRDLYKERGFDL